MEETSAAALSARRRRLLFRATHRGTKEADVLVGGYVAARLAALTDAELGVLERVLELPDPQLADWLTGVEEIPPGRDDTDILTDMRRFLRDADFSTARRAKLTEPPRC